jgi:hypothetical protein
MTTRPELAAEIRTLREAKGHAVDNARAAASLLDAAVADGSLVPAAALEQMLADLHMALAQEEGQRLGGKSADAARFILAAIVRELERR